jgi:hypothetical protein
MSKFKFYHLFIYLLVLVALRAAYFGFNWETGLSMLVLGSLYSACYLILEFFQMKKDILSENDFRINVMKEIDHLKGAMSGVKMAQMNFGGKTKFGMKE